MGKKVDLYELLRVERTASPGELRKAYLALARKVHPDKCPGDPNAEENFKALQRAYSILKNPASRRQYDATGCADDESEGFWNAYERYRGVEVTAEDIEKCESEYRGSEDEAEALRDFYVSHMGDVSMILGSIIGSRDEDRPRFVEFFEEQRASGALPSDFDDNFENSKREIVTIDELDALDEGESIGSDDECDEEEEEADEETEEEEAGPSFIRDDVEEDDEYDSDEDEDEETAAMRKYRKGDRVRAKWRNGPKWYTASVLRVHRTEPRTYTVVYDVDGAKEEGVAARQLRALPDSPSSSTAAVAIAESSLPEPSKKRARVTAPQGNGGGQKRRSKRPAADSASGAASSADPLAEYGDLASLRARILGTQGKRQDMFDKFEQKWAKRK